MGFIEDSDETAEISFQLLPTELSDKVFMTVDGRNNDY